jgi:ubiquinone/menaquinone biosynthesis C-methylase UbiE
MRPNERNYRERLLRRLRPYLKAGMTVLDAGCGPGAAAEMLAELGCRVTAIDVEPHPAEWEARARLGIAFSKASAESLEFADGSFDAVWVMDALHHMEDPERGLAELARVAKPGAPVLVIESNRRNPILYLRMTLIAGHQTFSRARFRRMLAAVDPDHGYFMVESRCLPWSWPWLLTLQNALSDLLERARCFDPWLTYQIGVLKGRGRAARPAGER